MLLPLLLRLLMLLLPLALVVIAQKLIEEDELYYISVAHVLYTCVIYRIMVYIMFIDICYFNLLSHSMMLLISAADSSSFPSPLQPTNSTRIGMSLNSKSFPCVPTSSFLLPDLPPSIPCRAADWLFLTSVLCRDHVRVAAKQYRTREIFGGGELANRENFPRQYSQIHGKHIWHIH